MRYEVSFPFFGKAGLPAVCSLCLFVLTGLFALQVKAQNVCDDKSFGISCTSTRSTCQSNGTITVSLTGDKDEFFNYQYQILGSGNVFTYPPQNENTLTGIPAGRHLVSVTALCIADRSVRKSVSVYVDVEGDYRVPEIQSVEKFILPSAPNCATGQYVFRVLGGHTENFRYRIISAPAELQTPMEFTPRVDGEELYVPFDLPAGAYTLAASDDCYEATRDFTISTSIEVPKSAVILNGNSFNIFQINPVTLSCDSVAVLLRMREEDLQRWDNRLSDYEYGIADKDKEPEQWYTFVASNTRYISLPTGKKLSDYYYPLNRLYLHIRHKRCHEARYQISRFMSIHRNHRLTTQTCTDYVNRHYISRNSVHNPTHSVCFPVTVKRYEVDENDTRTFLDEFTLLRPEVGAWGLEHTPGAYVDVVYLFNRKYFLEFYDAEGVRFADNEIKWFKGLEVNSFALRGCKVAYLYSLRGFANCTVFAEWREKESGKIVYVDTLRNIDAVNRTTPRFFDYETEYVIQAKDENGQVLLQTEAPAVSPPPKKIPLDFLPRFWSKEQTDLYQVNYKYLENWVPDAGDTLQIFDPEGRLIHQEVFKVFANIVHLHNPGAWHNYNLFTKSLKEGTYTSVLHTRCGKIVDTYELKYPHQVDLTYTQTYDCLGSTMRLLGEFLWEGKPAGNAFYQIVNGTQTGYPTERIPLKTPIILLPGRYELAIGNRVGVDNFVVADLVVNIRSMPLQLDANKTVAYACADNQSTQGYMFVKAKNGIEPYHYELWNADNTQKMPVDFTLDSDGVAEFVYGSVDETYTIRVRDACGNNFSQRITINDLSSFSIASVPDNFICMGDEIRLYALPMVRYEWEGPDGFSSSEQNPRIRNATRSKAGRYKVVGYPRGCGKGVTGYVDINVEPCWVPINPNLMHRPGSLQKGVGD